MCMTIQTALVDYAIKNGGSIHPLIIDTKLTGGTGLMNPSVYLDGDQLLVNIRHVNYTLYHSEGNNFEHMYGPLQYIHPEEDRTLTTTNYIGVLNDQLELEDVKKVDTSRFDVDPKWEFVGLEDARLVRWNKKLYMCGVRRDTTTNGVGRMEMSEIKISKKGINEVSRTRFPAPAPDTSYCEKNWMPILDMPFHFVKWSNPTEVVKVDLKKKTCETVVLNDFVIDDLADDLRGGSQVIPWGDGYLTLTHEVRLFNSEVGRKNGSYKHRFIVWDKNWEMTDFSPHFTFLGGEIEFSCGAAVLKDDLIITFGFQDNAAFALKMSIDAVQQFIDQEDA
jgi:hypothetical protein